jgi:hypothetical protein
MEGWEEKAKALRKMLDDECGPEKTEAARLAVLRRCPQLTAKLVRILAIVSRADRGGSEFDRLINRFKSRPPGTDPVPVGDDHPRPKPRPPTAAEAKLEFRDDEPDQN